MNQVPQAHASVLAQAGKRRSYCSIEIWGAYRRGHEFTWRQGLWTLKMILMPASEQGSHELLNLFGRLTVIVSSGRKIPILPK